MYSPCKIKEGEEPMGIEGESLSIRFFNRVTFDGKLRDTTDWYFLRLEIIFFLTAGRYIIGIKLGCRRRASNRGE